MKRINRPTAEKLFNKGELITMVQEGQSYQSRISRHCSKEHDGSLKEARELYLRYYPSKNRVSYFVGNCVEY